MHRTPLRFLAIVVVMLAASVAPIARESPVAAQGQSTLTVHALDCVSPGPDASTIDPNACDGTPGAGIEFSVGNLGTGNVEVGSTDETGTVTFGLQQFAIGPEPQVLASYTPLANPAGEIVGFEVACFDAGGAPFLTETYEGAPPDGPPVWGILFSFSPGDQITCDWTSWLRTTGTGGPTPPAAGSSITIYQTACPPGYQGESYFEDCFANPQPDVDFSAMNVKSSFDASGRTNAAGVVTLLLPDELAGNLVTISEVPPVEVPGGAEPPFAIFCTRNDGQAVEFRRSLIQLDPGGDAYNVEIGGIAPGDQIRCDWYSLPAAGTEPPATGIPSGGIGLSRAEWEAVYGAGEGTERGISYGNTTSPMPGQAVLVRTGEAGLIRYLEFTYDGSQLSGAPVADVQAQVAGAMPADAELVASFSLPATPDSPISLRAEVWESASLAAATGNTGAILATFEELTARQNPSSPAQTVVSRVRITVADAE